MVDGLNIMLIGMGVVFLFLIALMGFIRLIGIRSAASGRAAKGSADDVVNRVAAIAVALELSRSGPPRPVLEPAGAADKNAWRHSGRSRLHQGPEIVEANRAARRGKP